MNALRNMSEILKLCQDSYQGRNKCYGEGKITITYELTPKVETIHKATDLLLAEMTSGMQYISTCKGVQMYKYEDRLPFIDDSVKGEVLSIEEEEENTQGYSCCPLL